MLYIKKTAILPNVLMKYICIFKLKFYEFQFMKKKIIEVNKKYVNHYYITKYNSSKDQMQRNKQYEKVSIKLGKD